MMTGDFARELWAEWRRREWPVRDERAVVAVSGGADSTALLLALDELSKAGRLGIELTVAHLDHGLRGEEGAEDARWVAELARRLGRECAVGRAELAARGELARRAAAVRDNLEQAARRARYAFLSETAERVAASAVLTGHTLDDQAETVLLRLMRGSGAEGLSGMRAERPLAEGSGIVLRRPLLGWARRRQTEDYCRTLGVEFRADPMNDDERFARVRVRRRLLPLLAEFNPRAVEALARTADLLREDAAALEESASQLLAAAQKKAAEGDRGGAKAGEGAARPPEANAPPVSVAVLREAPAALRRRALRLWLARGRGDLRRIEAAHLLAVERLLGGERGGRVAELPGGGRVERRRGQLLFRPEKV
jgi:tRNA(Ile)-lysidine synthase